MISSFSHLHQVRLNNFIFKLWNVHFTFGSGCTVGIPPPAYGIDDVGPCMLWMKRSLSDWRRHLRDTMPVEERLAWPSILSGCITEKAQKRKFQLHFVVGIFWIVSSLCPWLSPLWVLSVSGVTVFHRCRTVYILSYRTSITTTYYLAYSCCAGWQQNGTACTIRELWKL